MNIGKKYKDYLIQKENNQVTFDKSNIRLQREDYTQFILFILTEGNNTAEDVVITQENQVDCQSSTSKIGSCFPTQNQSKSTD
jgi:hypothetical protein